MDIKDFASAFGSFGSAVGSSVIGAIAANSSAFKQFKYQSELQRQAAKLNYQYAQKTALNSPSWNRSGLESAGYNPMLAVQNATSGVNSSFTSPGNATAPDYIGGISSGIANAQSFQRLKNETAQTESVNDLNYAQADKAKAEKASIMERLPFISQREKTEIGNIEKDSMKKEAEIHNIEETTRYIEKNYELQKRLGEMGINAQIYGANQSYNASTYSANKSFEAQKLRALIDEVNNIRTNKTNKRRFTLPFGAGGYFGSLRD